MMTYVPSQLAMSLQCGSGCHAALIWATLLLRCWLLLMLFFLWRSEVVMQM